VEALWALTGFLVFDSIRRHTSFEEVVEKLSEWRSRSSIPSGFGNGQTERSNDSL
jgi:hypothetical protein